MEMHVDSGYHRRRLCRPHPPEGPCTGPRDPVGCPGPARHARTWIGIVVASLLLVGCGGTATRVPSGVHQAAPPASSGSTAAAGASAFAPLTREMMARLRASVTLPLMAPAGDLNPFIVEAQAGQALGAWIKTGAAGSAYWVAVGYCPLPAPWQTVVGRSCDGAIASEVAGFRFGGQAYPNAQAALAAVAPAAPPTGAHVPVALGAGVQGQEYAGGGGTVLWRDGDWHLGVDAAGCPAHPRRSTRPVHRTCVGRFPAHARAAGDARLGDFPDILRRQQLGQHTGQMGRWPRRLPRRDLRLRRRPGPAAGHGNAALSVRGARRKGPRGTLRIAAGSCPGQSGRARQVSPRGVSCPRGERGGGWYGRHPRVELDAWIGHHFGG